MPFASRFFALGVLALALALPAAAQVRLQVIHNAADPAAAVVDVYVNGVNTLDDFAFRTATGFLDLPANTDLAVAIAPGNSTGVADAIFSQTFNLPAGAYQLIATGVLTPSSFAANPDGRSTGFQLLAGLDAQVAGTGGNALLRVVHGATDAPTVDVRVNGGVVVNDVAYGDVTGYLPLPPAIYPLAITTADGGFVAGFEADLTGAANAAVTVLASGFLTPSANQGGAAFGLLAVFADGSTALLPGTVINGRLQVIHNAADPAASVVDVYLNNALLLDDFAFRTATPFIDVPAETALLISVAPGNSTSSGDAVFSNVYSVGQGSTTQLVANGVLTPSSFAPNPDGVSTAFDLLVNPDAQEASNTAGQTAIRVVHGATDAPTVDVRTGGVVLFDDVTYRDTTDYLTVAPQFYVLDITLADGSPVASFAADLSGAAGAAATVLASGFLTPSANQNGPAFGLLVAFADGTTALLPVGAEDTPEAGSLVLGVPAPNPMAQTGRVAFSLDTPGHVTLDLYDALGRRVAVLAEGSFGADRHEATLRTDGLAAGVYVLRLATEAGVRTRTVTVVR